MKTSMLTFCTMIPTLFALMYSSTSFADESDVLTVVNDDLVVTESMEGALTINWEKPRSYTDVRRSNGNPNSKKYRHRVFKNIHGTFEELVGKLPDGFSMNVVVDNLDLAGDTRTAGVKFGSGLSDVRIMRQIDIPRMSFSYEVKDDSGEVVSSQSLNLKDMNYLQGASRMRSSEPLFYETRMLTKWFKKEFKNVLQADT